MVPPWFSAWFANRKRTCSRSPITAGNRSELLTLETSYHERKNAHYQLVTLALSPVFTRRLGRERIMAVPALASSRWPSAL